MTYIPWFKTLMKILMQTLYIEVYDVNPTLNPAVHLDLNPLVKPVLTHDVNSDLIQVSSRKVEYQRQV